MRASLLVGWLRPALLSGAWPGPLALLVILVAGLGTGVADPADPDLERGEILLKRLGEQAKQPSGDREALRNELLKLRRTYPGTTVSRGADALLREVPSALDRLDPATIPALEKFAWQPKELAAVLGEHRGRHGNIVSAVAYSPDGHLIVSAGGHYLRVWDPATMRLRQLVGHGNAYSVAFSKDGKLLAVGSAGAVSLYDIGAQPLQLRWTATAGTSTTYGVAFAPSGKTLAVACFDGMVRLFNTTTPKPGDPVLIQAQMSPVTAIAYSPDGKTLASGSADMMVRLWDATLEIPKEKAQLTGHTTGITALAFTPTGTTLAAAAGDGSIRLYTVPSAAKAKERVAFADSKAGNIACLNFSATGKTLATACADGTVRLWNVTLARPQQLGFKLEGHAAQVMGVMYAPDNKTIVTGSHDWTCRTWDVSGAKPVERFMPWSHLSHVYTAAFSPDCHTLASGSLDTILRLWDLNRPEPKTRNFIKGDAIPIYHIVYSPDGNRLATSGTQATIRQFESASGKPLRSCAGLAGPPSSLAYSPDGEYLLSHYDKNIYLHEAATGQEARQLSGHTTRVYSVAFSPSGKLVLSSSGDYQYGADGKIVQIEQVPQYTDCTVRLWDAEKAKEIYCVKEHKKPVSSALFSPDGQFFYAGGSEPALLKREVAHPEKEAVPAFPGSPPTAWGFQFSPDGTRLLTSTGYRLVLWDLATGKPIWDTSYQEVIGSVAIASDSRHLAVTLGTGVIYVVRLSPPTLK